MTLQDILRHEPPQRRARIPKGSPRQKKLYDFICAHFSEIETAQEQGAFVRKERDIKGVQ